MCWQIHVANAKQMLHEKLHQAKPPSHQSVKQSVCPSVSQRVWLRIRKNANILCQLHPLAWLQQLLNCVSDGSEELQEQAVCGCQAKSAFGLRKMQFAGK